MILENENQTLQFRLSQLEQQLPSMISQQRKELELEYVHNFEQKVQQMKSEIRQDERLKREQLIKSMNQDL